jgi:hypothetical protein
MTPQLMLGHMAARADHERLEAQAARGWFAEEAYAARAPRRSPLAPIRHTVGAALVRVGERLGGRPSIAPQTTRVSTKAAA